MRSSVISFGSAQAAKDTSSLIEGSITRSNDGSVKLGDVSKAIEAIASSAAQVKTLVDEISISSQEQSRGSSRSPAPCRRWSR